MEKHILEGQWMELDGDTSVDELQPSSEDNKKIEHIVPGLIDRSQWEGLDWGEIRSGRQGEDPRSSDGENPRRSLLPKDAEMAIVLVMKTAYVSTRSRVYTTPRCCVYGCVQLCCACLVCCLGTLEVFDCSTEQI